MIAIILLMVSALAGVVQIEVLDVGQGDSILIQSPEGKTVLIDGGTGKIDVVQYLKDRNITALNMVVGTHAHADHIGGIDEVLEAIPVKLYMDNNIPHTTKTYEKVMTLVEEKEIRYLAPTNGQIFNLGNEVTLEVLNPPQVPLRNTRSDINSNSVVLKMMHGDNCFLFTGDAEEPTEHSLIQNGLGQCDNLKVAHHGSNHSSSRAFLHTVKPKIALISLGVDNRYGHPGEDAISRLEAIGAKIYRTDTQGTIKLESDGKKVTVTTLGKDGQKQGKSVVIEDYSDSEPSTKIPTTTKSDSQMVAGKFDLNLATSSQLESIPGIGPSKAAAILADKEKNGNFTAISDVQRVAGIGPKTAEKIAEYAFVAK